MAEADTSPGTARSPRKSASRSATTVAKPVIWPATASTLTSRSATPAAASDTSRRAARRSSATGEARSSRLPMPTIRGWPVLLLLSGAERSDTSPYSAARPARSTATTAASPATWPKSAPSRPALSPGAPSPLLSPCIISESSSVPRPVSSCERRKGVGHNFPLSAFNTNMFMFSLVEVLCIMLC